MIFLIFLSFSISMILLCKNMFDVIMMFPRKGYFVKSGNQEDYVRILDSAKEKIQYTGFNIKNALILCLPGINIFYSLYLNRKINNKIFEEFRSIPNFLKPMTTYDMEKFKDIRGFMNQLDYLLDLSIVPTKETVIDAEYYEIINEDEEKHDQSESVLNKYKDLRNDVNNFCSNVGYYDEDDYVLERRK